MTSDTATPVDARKAVVAALRALDRAALVPVLDAGHASRLAPTLGLVAAGATLSDEQVRDAARVLHAARDRIGAPLSAMGVTVPEPPAPVTRPDPPAAKTDQARPKVLMGADGRILVDSAYELRDTMKAIPGGQVVPADIRRRGMRAGTDPATGQPRRVHPSWSYPATPASAATLVYTLRPFDPMVWPAVRNLVTAHFETKRARESLVDESVPLPEHTPDGTDEVTMPLWEHQRRMVAIGEESAAMLAAMPMGSGKTSATIALANRRGWRRVLIVAPNRVRAVWTREVRERSTQDWHIEDGTRPARRRGARPQDLGLADRLSRAEFLLDDCTCGATTHAFVLNYEAMLSSEWQDWAPSEPLDAIVYDEAHRLKSYQMYPQRSGRKVGPEERKLGPGATAEQKALARRLDAMGPAERALRGGDEPPSAADLQRARARDKVTAKAEAEAEAKRLTISGLASRWVAISRFRIGLTGTPFPQHPWDIFGIMRALDPGVFGELWTPFRDYYLQMDASGNFPVRVAKARLEEFARRAMSLMYRPVVDLDLPGCTDVVRTVYLEPAARRAYDQLDAELFTDLRRFLAARGGEVETSALSGVVFAAADESDSEDGELGGGDDDGTMLTAKSLLSQLLRLQQITGGTLQADDGTGPHGERVPGPQARVSTAKIDMLGRLRKLPAGQAKTAGHTHELVGGDLFDVGCVPGRTDADGTPVAPEPVIVYCRFKADLDMVCELVEAAGLRYGEISGRSGKPDGLGADARMAPDVDVVGVQIQAGGTGIDLTRSAVGIWYSLGYSVSDYDQARARPYRPGQTRPVRFIHYVAADTKDEAVYDAIEQRRSAVSEVLRAGGVDPAALGIVDRDHGADPNAGQIGGRDNAQSAVSLPWESGKDGRR